jgi:hypothetical protein
MDGDIIPTTKIAYGLSDMNFGFTSEIAVETHPESVLSTRICNVYALTLYNRIRKAVQWIIRKMQKPAV